MKPAARTSRIAFNLLAVILLAGCASLPFVQGVKQTVPDLATELENYAKADDTLDTATRAAHIASAQAMREAATANPVTWVKVKAAWEDFRWRYTPYVDADADLDADEKRTRAEIVAKMDRLNDAEGERWIYFGGDGG